MYINALAAVPGVAQVNNMIIILFLYPFHSVHSFSSYPFLKFPLHIPGLHLPSPYASFPIKVFVGLPVERPVQVHPFQSKFFVGLHDERPIQVSIKLPVIVPI